MSEYQYFEFAAIDGPISEEGLRYARGCSSRAEVSRVRWQNTYTFGKGLAGPGSGEAEAASCMGKNSSGRSSVTIRYS